MLADSGALCNPCRQHVERSGDSATIDELSDRLSAMTEQCESFKQLAENRGLWHQTEKDRADSNFEFGEKTLAQLQAMTAAKNKALEALKRLAKVTDSEYPETHALHPINDGTYKLIAELEEVK